MMETIRVLICADPLELAMLCVCTAIAAVSIALCIPAWILSEEEPDDRIF